MEAKEIFRVPGQPPAFSNPRSPSNLSLALNECRPRSLTFGHDPSGLTQEESFAFVIKVIEGDYTVADNVDRLDDRITVFDRRIHLTFGVFVDEGGEADFFALLHD
jgi:hypothetical protein